MKRYFAHGGYQRFFDKVESTLGEGYLCEPET